MWTSNILVEVAVGRNVAAPLLDLSLELEPPFLVDRREVDAGVENLDLRILDSTDPDAVAAALDDLDPLQTLMIVASKSGTTVEPNAFLTAAWDRAG